MDSAVLEVLQFENRINDQRLAITPEKLNFLLNKANEKDNTPAPTCSDFVTWVFNLEHVSWSFQSGLGFSALSQMRRTIADVLSRHGDGQVSNWKVLSCDDGTESAKSYESSILTVNGKKLSLKPDLVMQNPMTKTIVVVEYKIPSYGVCIPKNGWPNLVSQLWAYSWVDDWADEQNVLLVGGIFNWYPIEENVEISDVFPRAVKTDLELNKCCARLFKKWGGEVNFEKLGNKRLCQLLRDAIC